MNIKQIAVIDCIYTISRTFLDIFVLAYIFQITKQSVFSVGIYYFTAAITVIIVAILISRFLSKGFFIQIYRLGIIFNVLFFISLSYLTKNVVLFGILFALSAFLRGISQKFLIYEYVCENRMIKFRGYLEFVKSIFKMVTPFIFGFILSKNFSFINTTSILLILLFIEYISTFSIKQLNKNKFNYKFNIYDFAKTVKNNSLIQKYYIMDFFKGMTILGVLPVAIIMYIIYLFETNFKLGLLTSLFALVTFLVNFLFGKYCRYGYFVNILKLSGAISITLSFLFILFPYKVTFIIYNISLATSMQFIWLLTEVNMFNIANIETIKNKFQTEYFVFRAIFSNFGKIAGFIILIIIGYFKYFMALKYFLLLLTISITIMIFYAIEINKNLFRKRNN